MEHKIIKYILCFLTSFFFIILSIFTQKYFPFIFIFLKVIFIIINLMIKIISLILIILLIIGLLFYLYKKYYEIDNYFFIIIFLIFLFKFRSQLWTFIIGALKLIFKLLNIILELALITGIIVIIFLFCKKYNKEIREKLEKLNEYIDDKIDWINDIITTLLDPKLRNAKKLARLFLSEPESYEYKKFSDKVNNFRLKDFQKLFESQFDYDNDDEINDFCNKYNINDIKGFKLLILKFQNFQIILSEWYSDKTKNEYLKQLWHLYPIMHKLKDKEEKELEKELIEANYSNWNKEDKITFKQCIENSPEIKAIQFNNYIENNIEEFGILIGNCVQFNNSFEKSKDMKEFRNKSDKFIKNLLKKGLKLKNNAINKINTFKDAIENRTFNFLIKKIAEKVRSNQTVDNYFKRMINLLNNNKIKDFISLNNTLISGINTAFSFFELGYHLYDLIQCFRELRNIDNYYFYYELRKISNNFENHKNEIKNIQGNDEKDLELILSILKKLKQDRDDILKLIQNVNEEKNEEVEKRNKNTKKVIKRAFATCLGFVAGAYLTGGVSTVISVTSGVINAIKLGKSGVKLINNIQQISYFENLLEEMIKKQNEIEKEIKSIKNLYFNIKYSHLPKDFQEKIKEKYSEE